MDTPERLMRSQRAGRAEEGPRDARVGRPKTVRIWLLGRFRVSVGTQTVEEGAWRLRKASALVKLLALAPGHHLHRERAMDLLWQEHGRHAAANNLSQALHAARRAIAPDDAQAAFSYLASQGEQLVLCPGGELWLDVDAFEEAAATARRSREPAAYRAALNLYAGELLPRDPYEEWAEVPREGLRQLFLALLVELASLHEERGEYGAGIGALRRVVVEEPTREEAHIGLMRLYALGGRQAETLAQYGRLEEFLSRELGAEPQASSRALREEIATGRFPPPHRLAGPPNGEIFDPSRHNLPAPRNSFVGREREIVEVKRALSMTRLLTLTGAGGSGKTRLALEVARDLVGAYPDGVWLVELAPLSEGTLMPQIVAGALGVKEQPGQPLTGTLAEALRAKEMLLILDNCEHLIDAVARFVDVLLDSCPHLRVLATSREVLGVGSEVRWAVRSLSVLDSQRLPTVSEVERSESARLFVERARNRKPTFALGPGNARTVAEIGQRLEGIPLAIELAAARVGTLAVEQISERIEDSLKLLTSGGRTAVPRHRTLRGALDWSHELLSESERKLFRRLSAFMGGWTLEVAEAVVSGGGIEEGDVLDVLSGLVDKSLVVAETTGEGGVRYRLLEPVRQYALQKQEASGEAEEVRRRHAEFFLALAEEAEPRLREAEDVEWLERLEREHDNLRAALSWALERGNAELALRLAGALWTFWQAHGHEGERRKWLEEALAEDDRASVAARAKALEGVCWMAIDQRDLDRAQAAAQAGLKLADELEIGNKLAASFRTMLGYTVALRGDYERAKELLEESLTLSREADDRVGMADALLFLGEAWYGLGDRARAKKLWEEGIILCREVGYMYRLPDFSIFLGYVSILEGDYERGAALNEEAAGLCRERGYKNGLQFALANLGWAALLRGDHERAKAAYEESLVVCKELGDKMIASESLEGLACVAGPRGEAEQAARLFGAAEALREAVGYQHMPEVDALREPYLAAAHSQLDDTTWEATWAQGKTMGLEEVIEWALSVEEPATPTPPTPKRPSAAEQRITLTRRAEEVATLVARGLTNRQIAEELVLSERTVENHVSNILKKLNLSSRSEVAAWVEAQHS